MVDHKDPPIEGQNFIGGVNVVRIGDVRVKRGLSRRPWVACDHKAMVYDEKERRIWCEDCETDVQPFDAFIIVAEKNHAGMRLLKKKIAVVQKAMTARLHRVAAKTLDTAWRSRTMVPTCPHCGAGIFAEDIGESTSMVGKEFELARRKRATHENV